MIAALVRWWHRRLGHYIVAERAVTMTDGARLRRRACSCGAKWYRRP